LGKNSKYYFLTSTKNRGKNGKNSPELNSYPILTTFLPRSCLVRSRMKERSKNLTPKMAPFCMVIDRKSFIIMQLKITLQYLGNLCMLPYIEHEKLVSAQHDKRRCAARFLARLCQRKRPWSIEPGPRLSPAVARLVARLRARRSESDFQPYGFQLPVLSDRTDSIIHPDFHPDFRIVKLKDPARQVYIPGLRRSIYQTGPAGGL
jgi:hypothetical protein